MNENKVVIGKRNKFDKILLIICEVVLGFLLIFTVSMLFKEQPSDEELYISLAVTALILIIFVATLILLIKLPEDLIVYDKSTKQLIVRAGGSMGRQMKTQIIDVADIDYIEYNKAEHNYYVVVSTHKAAHLAIKLKNGFTYGIISLYKPLEVKYKLEQIIKETKELE